MRVKNYKHLHDDNGKHPWRSAEPSAKPTPCPRCAELEAKVDSLEQEIISRAIADQRRVQRRIV